MFDENLSKSIIMRPKNMGVVMSIPLFERVDNNLIGSQRLLALSLHVHYATLVDRV